MCYRIPRGGMSRTKSGNISRSQGMNNPKPSTPAPYAASPEFMAKQLGIKKVKPATPIVPQSSTRKRKAVQSYQHNDEEEEDDEYNSAIAQDALAGIDAQKPKRARRKKNEEPEEKRLRRHRAKPPGTYLERLGRVRTQRMFLIDRNRALASDRSHDEEVFDIAGSTGNVYQVTVTKVPECTCPDAQKGNQCKHIIYVMVNVLKAREDLAYQLALLSTELTEIFDNAPVTPQSNGEASTATDTGGSRKPIEGDCPVCVMEFESGEDILWCKGACGNNIHRTCFKQWAKSKPGAVQCVYCRTPWKGDEDCIQRIAKSGGTINHEGYVNVGGDLGLSRERDTSSYHPYWVSRQYGDSYDRDYDEY